MLQMRKTRLKEVRVQDFQNDKNRNALQEKKVTGENDKKHSFKPLATTLRAYSK